MDLTGTRGLEEAKEEGEHHVCFWCGGLKTLGRGSGGGRLSTLSFGLPWWLSW